MLKVYQERLKANMHDKDYHRHLVFVVVFLSRFGGHYEKENYKSFAYHGYACDYVDRLR